MPFTITGTINTDVWLEYSTDNGSTWVRLPTLFPSGTSIATSELPTNVDLKVRIVAFCNPTYISNELEYDYVPPVLSCFFYEVSIPFSDNLNISYYDCQNNFVSGSYTGPDNPTFCAREDTVLVTGIGEYTITKGTECI
jgi:hypothetical protein